MPGISSHASNRLFFTQRKKDERWRLLEQLTAVIESYLLPVADPYAFSPAKVPNKVQDLVEVDVAYCLTSDPRCPFSFVQIRDRSNNIGRPYMEQVVGQKATLGINQAVVVSSSGFSSSALRLAKAEDIATRILRVASPEELAEWCSLSHLEIKQPVFKVMDVTSICKKGNGFRTYKVPAGLSPYNVPFLEPVENTSTQFDQITLDPTGRPFKIIPIGAVLNRILAQGTHYEELISKIPEDGHPHVATIAQEFSKSIYYLKSTEGVEQVNGLVLNVEAQRNFVAPLSASYHYIDAQDKHTLGDIVVAEFIIGDSSFRFCLTRTLWPDGQRVGGAYYPI